MVEKPKKNISYDLKLLQDEGFRNNLHTVFTRVTEKMKSGELGETQEEVVANLGPVISSIDSTLNKEFNTEGSIRNIWNDWNKEGDFKYITDNPWDVGLDKDYGYEWLHSISDDKYVEMYEEDPVLRERHGLITPEDKFESLVNAHWSSLSENDLPQGSEKLKYPALARIAERIGLDLPKGSTDKVGEVIEDIPVMGIGKAVAKQAVWDVAVGPTVKWLVGLAETHEAKLDHLKKNNHLDPDAEANLRRLAEEHAKKENENKLLQSSTTVDASGQEVYVPSVIESLKHIDSKPDLSDYHRLVLGIKGNK